MTFASPTEALASRDARLVDLVDGLLHHGVVIRGDVWLTVADVDLVFLGINVVLASPDTIRPACAE